MPTLKQLRQANRRTGDALREAEDRLGQAREAAEQAVRVQCEAELRSLREEVLKEDLAAARDRVSEARMALDKIRDELQPNLAED